MLVVALVFRRRYKEVDLMDSRVKRVVKRRNILVVLNKEGNLES